MNSGAPEGWAVSAPLVSYVFLCAFKKYCEVYVDVFIDTACGGRFRLRNRERYITSPGYPNEYTNSMECQYVIQVSYYFHPKIL